MESEGAKDSATGKTEKESLRAGLGKTKLFYCK